ncbi:MAG: NUDIX hydrolase [Planctomycetes bacterium]|nr:NUDIX hydrolase [Planctomycetota bacterium]
MPARLIHLRRPPVLQVQDELFVPDGNILDEVDQRWAALCDLNSAYFDGRMYHVLGVHRNGYGGAVIHVIECAYRFYAVQRQGFDLGVCGLGVKGLTIRNQKALLGKRSASVSVYRNKWEFAPGGVVEPGKQPTETIVTELHEETGLLVQSEPTPIAMICDSQAHTWEIIYTIKDAQGDANPTPEYTELRWCERDKLPSDLSPIATSMISLWPKQT